MTKEIKVNDTVVLEADDKRHHFKVAKIFEDQATKQIKVEITDPTNKSWSGAIVGVQMVSVVETTTSASGDFGT